MTLQNPVQTLPKLRPARPEPRGRRFPAVLVAGDGSHSRTVAGHSKAFVEVGGQPMVLHVLDALLQTPQISEVFVVGDPGRLEQCLAASGVLERAARASRAVHIVPQRNTLYENVWHGFLRSAPSGTPTDEHMILVVPADIPLVLWQEISEFIDRAVQTRADYVIGLTPGLSLERFAPREGRTGVEMACFNLREGRFRQNNMHLVRPLRMGNRHYIEDMYASRHQKELGSMIRLALQVFVREFRQFWVLAPYLFLHLGGLLDRHGWSRSALVVRNLVSLDTVHRASSGLLRTRFCTAVTTLGGAALDVDNDADREAVDKMFSSWRVMQLEHSARAMLCARE